VNRDLQCYRDDGVGFTARYLTGATATATASATATAGRGRIRVARTLLTCAMAVQVLNEIRLPSESETAYRYINVHNPRCPLFYEFADEAWACHPGLERHPVWGINWAGAALICRHLGARLPTRFEWESFASNNDPERTYPWGDAAPTFQLANFGEHFGGTSVVSSFPASDLGLYDLAGNLSEWCSDRFETADGRTAACERVVKGGAWSKDASHLEIATSRGKWERLGTTTIGFRPVWDDS